MYTNRDIDVSIIVPVYNVADYVAGCLRSVMAQDAACAIECIVVDDRGCDDSMKIVAETVAEYDGPIDFVTITREQNGGLSAARNTGISHARGRYVFFLDSDDALTPNAISRLWAHVEAHPGVDVVFGVCETTPEPRMRGDIFDFKAKGALEYCDDLTVLRAQYLSFIEIAADRLIRREWLLDNNLTFLEGILYEDRHWHVRSYEKIRSYACEMGDEPTYMYLQRGTSITGSADKSAEFSNYARIYTDLAQRLTLWDRQVMLNFCGMIMYFKLRLLENRSPELKAQFRSLMRTLLTRPDIGWRQKAVFRYLSLPTSISRRRVAYALTRLLVPAV